MPAGPPLTQRKYKLHPARLTLIGVLALGLVGLHLMFFFWPFRYRQVHPLLEKVFRSEVDVKTYYRTYFPHPGFVAEDITFYRHGDTHIPPLATLKRMTVSGTWSGLILHPHTLYLIRLEGVHVQIPPPGTKARGTDFDGAMISPSEHKLKIQTIVADHTVLDFLRHGQDPMRFLFSQLQVHDVESKRPLTFFAKIGIPGPQGMVESSGQMGPFDLNHYGVTPLRGTYSLENADLSLVDGVSGHMAANGQYGGTVANLAVSGKACIPDFRAGSAHTVRFDADYNVTVTGTNGDVQIHNATVKTGQSVISASGSVTGSPRKVSVNVVTKNSPAEELLDIVQKSQPAVTGRVSLQASADFLVGPEPFLRRLGLKGEVSVDQMQFVKPDTRQKVDAFSARVRKDPAGDPKKDAPGDPPGVKATAWTQTTFQHGMAYFPDIHASLPGAQAELHGTFNLLDYQIHLTGNVALEKGVSHAVTGWKSWLLKPLSPFFKKKDAGAVVPIAVTGTAQQPKVGQDLLHDK